MFEHAILLKIYLRRIHLCLAFACALLLISLSISGALLLYAKTIQAKISPESWQVDSHVQGVKKTVLPLSKLAEKLFIQTNEKIDFIEVAAEPEKAWKARLANANYLNFNPYTGEVLSTYSFYDSFYGFCMAWHRWLLYTNEQNERPLQLWVSIASLVFILEILVGSYLWLKPRHRIRRLKVKWQAKRKVLFYQLHGSLGVILCLPLVLVAFSGMAFFWSDATKQVVEFFTQSKVQQHHYQVKNITATGGYQLDKAYQSARLALHTGKVFRIYLPGDEGQVLKLRIKMPDETHAYSWSWANPYTGELLHYFDASNTSMATQVWNFKYKFHIGEFIGWPVKLLWLMIALTPCFLVVSGLYLWIKRK